MSTITQPKIVDNGNSMENTEPKLSTAEWSMIKPVYIAVFIDIFGVGITIPVFSYFLLDLNGSTTSIGLILRYKQTNYKAPGGVVNYPHTFTIKNRFN